ncbi:hypothetical protein GMOD_00008494 [Pyrenophora seminiperda CCB06]|uniref:Uncharacterized protein n=1 Tax=Pyrenophora seminiperda CCB06 TaxID=1302712 RepID=A0A3M7M8Y1_9PLEO|nr:hypothetical protein GMOD_00008494 [Pyrenophora seminiperda CCB06]
MVSTRPSSRAGSRSTSGSGGVLGLPGTVDLDLLYNTYDPNQFDPAIGNSDNFFDLDHIDFSGLDLPLEDFDMSQFLTSDAVPQHDQGDRGLSFSPIQAIQIGGRKLSFSPIHTIQIGHPASAAVPKSEVEDDQGPHVVPLESSGNPPIDPALDRWNPNMSTQASFVNVTPGFSAIPQGTDLIPQFQVPAQPAQMYPDPNYAVYPTGPYFTQPQDFAGYVPKPAEQPVKELAAVAQQTRKRKHDRSGSGSGSDSDDESPIAKRPRSFQQKRTPRSASSRRPSTSDGSSISKPVKTRVVKPGQKPKKVADKTWVRTNTTTRGETTRTARINLYTEEGDKYKMKDLPRGNWESTNYKFEYMQIGRMHELKKCTMSARQIHEYITEHPGDLRIWIQPVASDSARRYFSATQNHCRFAKCPMRRYTGKGTTEVGNYRVAFDEKHLVYGEGVADPYDCVGYAHLYCMERFLDFAYVCQVANVKVDQRVSLESEPKGVFGAAFGLKHHHEIAVAKTFIQACRKGRLSETRDFADYPVHEDYAKGAPKPHERTLVYALYEMNIEHRPLSQMKQFICDRVIRPSSFTVHRGDMEVKLVNKKIEMLEVFNDWIRDGGTKDNFNYSAYYDSFHPEINVRIQEMLVRRDQMLVEEAANTSSRGRKRRAAPTVDIEDEAPARKRSRRQVIAIDSDFSEDETTLPKRSSTKRKRSKDVVPLPKRSATRRKRYEDVFTSSEEDDYEEIGAATQRHPQHGNRSSPRQVQRINYAESQDVRPHTRRATISDLFPVNNDLEWDNLDLESLPAPLNNDQLLTQAQIDALMAINRRKSSTLSNGPGAWRKPRTASFNKQPVSSSTEFRRNDPPSRVKSAPVVMREDCRRSNRLASKVGSM